MSTRRRPARERANDSDELVVAELVLGPCLRPGDPSLETDWWEEQHIFCTGSEHLTSTKVVRCTCACHTDERSQEGLDRLANSVRRDMREDGNVTWRYLRMHDPKDESLG